MTVPLVPRAVPTDTSFWVATELGRTLDLSGLPDDIRVSVITAAELQAGVLAAPNTVSRAIRLATLDAASRLEPLPLDARAARF